MGTDQLPVSQLRRHIRLKEESRVMICGVCVKRIKTGIFAQGSKPIEQTVLQETSSRSRQLASFGPLKRTVVCQFANTRII